MSAASPPRRGLVLAVLSLSLLVISLDNTILNVALPTLSRDLAASAGELQWIVDVYLLVFAGLLLTAGSLGDRYGRRRALLAGLVVFGAGSILAALSGGASELIASRALMGLGGAFVMPTTLSILTNVFPAEERGRAIGVWAAVAGLGIALGPIAGGWLLEHFAWGSIFLVNVPIVAVAIVAGVAIVPESRDPEEAHLDPVGAVLSIVGLAALVWAIIEAPTRGWTGTTVLAGFGFAAVVLLLFTAWERRTATPMLDLRVLRNRRFSAASAAITFVFFALMGTIFLLTQYLQFVLGYEPLRAGLAVAPIAVGMVIAGPASARLSETIGTKLVVATGLTVVAAGLVVLSGAGVDTGYGPVGLALVVLGFGMGATMAPATEAIMGSLPLAHAGVGSATNDTTRMVGGALGVAVLGSLLSSGYGAGMNGALAGLPGPAADAAHDGIGGAVAVADRLGGPAGEALVATAKTAFVSGMETTVLAAAAIAFAGALIALAFLPAREESAVEPTRSTPESLAVPEGSRA